MKTILKAILKKIGIKISRVSKTHDLTQASIPFYKFSSTQAFNQIGTFTTLDGTQWPVYDDYRYKIKPCWTFLPSLLNISYLVKNTDVNQSVSNKLSAFIGKHTITAPIEEIDQFTIPLLSEYSDHFEADVSKSKADTSPRLSEDNLQRLISDKKIQVAAALLQHTNLPTGKRLDMLDVGCGRGVTTVAYAQLGFNAVGIDNDYGDNGIENSISEKNRAIAASMGDNVKFHVGDITKCPEIPDNSYDYITSISCLEHIVEIDDALSEMFRILRPGGIMLHSYNPFWCENGGHVLGVLDAPWLHAALSVDDFERYINEWHPHEAQMALPWSKHSLNRNITINSLQRSLISAGFEISKWQESVGGTNNLSAINHKLLHNIHKNYPDVSIADLLATDITFVARKPMAD